MAENNLDPNSISSSPSTNTTNNLSNLSTNESSNNNFSNEFSTDTSASLSNIFNEKSVTYITIFSLIFFILICGIIHLLFLLIIFLQ